MLFIFKPGDFLFNQTKNKGGIDNSDWPGYFILISPRYNLSLFIYYAGELDLGG
ncbi:MAG: hypothetical protein ACOCV1_05255 [Bacillota bacterium]